MNDHDASMRSAADKMAYELCKATVGHPMNCQCESDKALREYLKSKSAMPRIIVAGEKQAKGLARLSAVWKWLTSRTTRRRGIALKTMKDNRDSFAWFLVAAMIVFGLLGMILGR